MGERVRIKIRYLENHDGLPPLARQTPGSSGFDLHAACPAEIRVAPGGTALVPAGFQIAIPSGYEAQVRPRSGLALRSGIGLLNAPGTVDSDYRGEVCAILHNFGTADFVVRRGDRIAQLVITPLPPVEIVEESSLDETDRGSGGFGHTG